MSTTITSDGMRDTRGTTNAGTHASSDDIPLSFTTSAEQVEAVISNEYFGRDGDEFICVDAGVSSINERLDRLALQFDALVRRMALLETTLQHIETTARTREARKQNELLRRGIPFPFAPVTSSTTTAPFGGARFRSDDIGGRTS